MDTSKSSSQMDIKSSIKCSICDNENKDYIVERNDHLAEIFLFKEKKGQVKFMGRSLSLLLK